MPPAPAFDLRPVNDETGIPHLDKQITAVTTLMAVSDDKPMFDALLKKRFPRSGDQMAIVLEAPKEENKE